MTLLDKIALLEPKDYEAKWAPRIYGQLCYAAHVSAANDDCLEKLLNDAADFVLAQVREEGDVTKTVVLKAEEMLAPAAPLCKSYTAHCIGHAHIDMNWMWGYNETVSVTVDTFRTVLDLMKEYPDFTFSQSQASTYRIIAENAPEMLGEIKQRIREGRWEVSASTWVENDKNMPSGESLARHILYTKRYLGKLLDIPEDSMKLDFEPDTFGHNISVPEVCAKGGVQYYYHCRGQEIDCPAFVWRSRAGHDVLVYNEPHWYGGDFWFGLLENYPLLCKKMSCRDFPVVYGVGDHGGGPTRRDLDHITDIATWPIMCTVQFSSYRAFFEKLENARNALPVRTGETNFVFTGCYTSQSRIKMANRVAEDRMNEAEFLATFAENCAKAPKRAGILRDAWEKILFNQFHDILPGSGVRETREYAMGRFQEAMGAIQTSANNALRSLAEQIDTSSLEISEEAFSMSDGAGVGYGVGENNGFVMPVSGRGSGKNRVFHLFNATNTDFDGVTRITVWDWMFDANRASFADEKGNPAQCAPLESGNGYWGHEYKVFAVWVKVPAFGYATYTLTEKSIKSLSNAVPLQSERRDTFNDDSIVLENNRVRAVFDHASMQLLSLTDKASGKQMINSPSARFLFIAENTVHGMTSWRVGDRMKVQNLNEEQNVTVQNVQKNACCQSVSYSLPFGERSTLKVNVSLDENAPYLVFETKCDFHEVGDKEHTPALSFEAPLGYAAGTYRYDVPFGTIDREGIAHDVPANSFAAALPEEKEGACVVLMTDSKYGFRGWNDTLNVNLIRASTDPDPYPEYGMHTIRIALGVAENCENNCLYDFVAPFIHPLSLCCARKGNGHMPLKGTFLEAKGVRVSAVKSAEDGKGIVLRLFESRGEDSAYSVTIHAPASEAWETDITERAKTPVTLNGNTVSGTIAAYEMKTILIKTEDIQ